MDGLSCQKQHLDPKEQGQKHCLYRLHIINHCGLLLMQSPYYGTGGMQIDLALKDYILSNENVIEQLPLFLISMREKEGWKLV